MAEDHETSDALLQELREYGFSTVRRINPAGPASPYPGFDFMLWTRSREIMAIVRDEAAANDLLSGCREFATAVDEYQRLGKALNWVDEPLVPPVDAAFACTVDHADPFTFYPYLVRNTQQPIARFHANWSRAAEAIVISRNLRDEWRARLAQMKEEWSCAQAARHPQSG